MAYLDQSLRDFQNFETFFVVVVVVINMIKSFKFVLFIFCVKINEERFKGIHLKQMECFMA